MKIGIIGTAPQFVNAPFHDKSWRIWSVPGCYGVEEDKKARNAAIERIYEFHNKETMAITCEPRLGFIDFAKGIGKRFILREKNEAYPKARVFNYRKYVDKHGRAPFSCSVSWMMAEAIAEIQASGEDGSEIGIWGVNMAHDSEYVYQKPGVRHMIGYAEALGIKVTVPDTSELMALHSLYGVEELPPLLKVISGRTKELYEKKLHYEKEEQLAVQSINYFNGALGEYEFLGSNPTPEQTLARKESVILAIDEQKKNRDESLRMMHIYRGAVEEHIWVEQNFFKSAG